jgi:hypothetical protein
MRLGRFTVAKDILLNINFWGIICKEIYPIEMDWHFDHVDVLALSNHFESVNEGEVYPVYEIIIESKENKINVQKVI